jgi:hypothetical protein
MPLAVTGAGERLGEKIDSPWLQMADWTKQLPSNANLSYELSAQLAATELNVLSGYVKTTDLIYAGGLLPYVSGYSLSSLTSDGFITIGKLMSAANAELALVYGLTRSRSQR